MSGWFKKKSPRPSSSPAPQVGGLTRSGSVERPRQSSNELKLEGGGQGLYNPLAWENMPTVLKQQFPHWKESSPAVVCQTKAEEPSFQFSASSVKHQPAFTIPYVVMENDTIHSIAVKFETTPTDIARINKKSVTLPLFPGEVIYVPDQDELAHRCESPEEEVGSPMEEKEIAYNLEGVEEGEEPTQEFIEEVTDTHIVILSKYISEDQGCVHGSLMLNRSSLTFSPRALDPLVREHGTANFEMLIPLSDISYAAFSRDISCPRPCFSRTSPPHVQQEQVDQGTSDTSNLPQDSKSDQDDSAKNQNHLGEQLATNDDGGSPLSDHDSITPMAEKAVSFPLSNKGNDGSLEKSEEREVVVENGDGEQADQKEEASLESGSTPALNEEDSSLADHRGEILTGEGENPSPSKEDEEEAAQIDSQDSTPTPTANRSIGLTTADDQVVKINLNTSATVTDSPGTIPSVSITSSSEETRDEDVEHKNQEATTSAAEDHHQSTDNLMAQLHLGGESADAMETSESTDSLDSKLANQAIFLHLHVTPRAGSPFTYTPINSSVGIDIPKNHKTESRVQHVKSHFCFAVAEKRMDDLVHFIVEYHPSREVGSSPPDNLLWVDNVYEFIGIGSSHRAEDLQMQDDFYGTSSSWEVYSLKDVPRLRIEGMDVEANLPLPTLCESSDLLQDDHLKQLSLNLPSQAVGCDWYLVYSTFKHGISLRTMYRNMQMFDNEDSPVILVIRDDCGKIFGAALTCPVKISEKFYGTGESYLYSFDSPTELKIFSWTGLNNYIVKGNSDSFSIGSGEGHPGLWLDEYFYHGSSYKCPTFNNECLASKQDFICSGVEAWGFLTYSMKLNLT